MVFGVVHGTQDIWSISSEGTRRPRVGQVLIEPDQFREMFDLEDGGVIRTIYRFDGKDRFTRHDTVLSQRGEDEYLPVTYTRRRE